MATQNQSPLGHWKTDRLEALFDIDFTEQSLRLSTSFFPNSVDECG
jgi:hypothetical protein